MRKTLVMMVLLMAAMWVMAEGRPQHPSPVDGAGVTLPNGLAYWDLTVGTGKVAAKGSKVKVHYTGWLLEEGTEFDSSYGRKDAVRVYGRRRAGDQGLGAGRGRNEGRRETATADSAGTGLWMARTTAGNSAQCLLDL